MFTLISMHLIAQSLPVARNYQNAFDKNTRSASGKPGNNYWQNTAAYAINVSFIPSTRMMTGTENITYINNSPDTLNQVWFKLYPNIYKKGVHRDQDIDASDLSDGVSITGFAIDGTNQSTETLNISGTNMYLPIPSLLPGQQMKFDLGFS